MSRKIQLTAAFLLLFITVKAQSTLQSNKIAPFNIKLTNGSTYTAKQLAKGPVVLIYFSPDCHHCVDFTEDMLKNYSTFANKQIVMITFQDMSMLQPFAKKYKISQYPNIKIGTEGNSYIVQKYYQIRSFPYIALYDKNGNWVKTFEGTQPHSDIFNAVKGL
tara:strand:- start:154 stop:639 length:486 start_codon:yes stop_codon:yes gene_type:complete